MLTINIKPLTVNQAWQGKRFKTNKYDLFIDEMLKKLPDLKIENTQLTLNITFGVSSKLSDLDNLLKCTIDCFVKKYGVDDRNFYKIIAEKQNVKKGNEFIKFEILTN